MRSAEHKPADAGHRATAAPEKSTTSASAQSSTSFRLATRGSGHAGGSSVGAPLDAPVRRQLEESYGAPLGNVRLHTGPAANRLAESMRAAAFTAGSDIYFGPSALGPNRQPGRRILAHEVAHAAQNRGTSARPAAGRGAASGLDPASLPRWSVGRRDDPAEHHAERAASAFLSGGRARISTISSAAPVIRRVPDDAPEAAAPALTNARFVGDRTLERILDGRIARLSSAHNGRRGAVSKVQQALVDLGFELPMHLVDGSYGGETEEALRQFRAHQGLPAGSILDAQTLAALDRAAPPPGETRQQTVDYDRLLADRRLDITVAIGHTDTTVARETAPGTYERTDRPTEELMAERFRAWLTARTFRLELLGWASNEYWKATRTITWTDRDGNPQSREIDIWLNLIVPGAGAALEFREGLSSSEITVYAGHARYGSGPDFDAKASPTENFRIGIDQAMRAAGRRTTVDEARRHGVGVDEENDLLEMVNSGDFDADRYRVLFFEACTSLAYLDEIREHVGDAGNVDVLATRRPSMFTTLDTSVGIPEVQRFLQGIFDSESIQSIMAALNEMQRQRHGSTPFPAGGIYGTSGFGDNPVAP